MKMDPNYSSRIEKLIDLLRAHGYKVTPARSAVLDTLQGDHEHFDPSTILERAKSSYPAIGRATVYRTLEMLTQIGVLRPIYSGQNTVEFIWAEGGHHHLICSDCGEVVEFEDCLAGEMTGRIEAEYGFKIRSHLLEFYGLCRACDVDDG